MAKYQRIDKMKLTLARRVLSATDWKDVADHYRQKYLDNRRAAKMMDASAMKHICELDEEKRALRSKLGEAEEALRKEKKSREGAESMYQRCCETRVDLKTSFDKLVVEKRELQTALTEFTAKFGTTEFLQSTALITAIAEKFDEKVNFERGRSVSPAELLRLVGVVLRRIDELRNQSF